MRPNHDLYSGSEFLITYLGFYSHLLIWLFTLRGLIVMCASESSHDLLRWLYHGKRNFERKGGWDGSNHGVFEKKYLSKTRLLFGTNPNQRTKDPHTHKMVPKKTYTCRFAFKNPRQIITWHKQGPVQRRAGRDTEQQREEVSGIKERQLIVSFSPLKMLR